MFLLGESQGEQSLLGCCLWGHTESDTFEVTSQQQQQQQVVLVVKNFPELEKEMATHSSVLAWRIPGMGEPVGLLSMGSHRVRHD